MSDEKKVDSAELSDEQMDLASGGYNNPYSICPGCQKLNAPVRNDKGAWVCPSCGCPRQSPMPATQPIV